MIFGEMELYSNSNSKKLKLFVNYSLIKINVHMPGEYFLFFRIKFLNRITFYSVKIDFQTIFRLFQVAGPVICPFDLLFCKDILI
jgi:hypothetical protein